MKKNLFTKSAGVITAATLVGASITPSYATKLQMGKNTISLKITSEHM